MPLQIGAPDVAFPRLNAFSYWLFLFGSLIAVSGFLTPGGAADFGWYRLHAAVRRRALARVPGGEPLDRRPGRQRSGHDPRWRQLHHHDRLPARARHDDVPDADLHLERAGHQRADPAGLPDPDRRALRPAGRPQPRRPRLLRRERRRDAVAAPVLVLRAPRGLHHRAAVLRHHHRDHPGLQPQAAVRLQGHGLRDAGHRGALARRVGAPHVRHRRGPAAVLRLPDLPDRRADRDEVLQLDRHACGGGR